MNERVNRKLVETATPEQPEESALATAGRKRPQRIPMGRRDRLKFKQEPGYHYHLFNDVKGGNRIAEALAAGYEFVEIDPRTEAHRNQGTSRTEDASQMGAHVTHPVGDGVTGFLMRIPEEFWNEDRAARDADIDELESGMRRPESRTPDKEGNYGGVDISDAARRL
jgi:hypothetical protein